MMLREYEDREELMDELADLVAMELEAAIAARGQASLSVPGGTTPAPFLQSLSEIDLDWSKVHVFLGDERFVEENSDRSNTGLLKKNLFIHDAKEAQFVPFIVDMTSPEASAEKASATIDALLPIDVLVVGMGEDMHTASLFPDSPDLPDALRDDAPSLVVIRAENAGEPRISLSARALKSARHKHVLIAGAGKKSAYEKALSSQTELEAPIRVVIASEPKAIVHYAK